MTKRLGSGLVRAGLVAGITAATAFAPVAQAQEIEEIVVSARKRTETLQTVPVSVSAVTSDTIVNLNLQDFSDIAKLSAGIIFDNDFGRTSNRPVIRGQANILGESGVSYFIDGVYIEGSLADFDLNDVERFEIIKGPQSALYGRNTYAGAINIITKSPGDTLDGNVAVTLTNDDEREVSASIRGPITDTLSGGITLRRFQLDGPWTNEFDNSDIGEQESNSLSAVLQWAPNERLSARFRAYYNDLDDGQPPLFAQRAINNNCFEDNGALYAGLGRYFCGTVSPQPINTNFSVQAPDAREEQQTLQTSLAIDYELNDAWTLTSITGFNRRDGIQVTDGDYSDSILDVSNFTTNGVKLGPPVPTIPAPYGYARSDEIVDFTFSNWSFGDDISQELRFAFEGERVSALLGAYYFRERSESRDIRELPANADEIIAASIAAESAQLNSLCAALPDCLFIFPFDPTPPVVVVPRNRSDDELTNTAVFGLVEFPLSDTVSLTLEGRYQEEEIEQVAILQDLGGPVEDIVRSKASFDAFLQRYTLDWQATDDMLLYGVVATGTKPGGFNGPLAIRAGLPTFDEEDVTSVELGAKTTWLDGALTANVAIFSNEIDGYQLTQNARSGANTTSATVNAGDARINGFELESTWRAGDILALTLNYAYTDAEFTDGVDENQGVLNDVADDGLRNCSLGEQFDSPTCTASDSPTFGSIDGKKIPRTAENMLFLDAELRDSFNADWEWFAGINYTYESSKFAQVHNLAETGDTSLVGARFGVESDKYSVILFGRNVFGEDSSPLVLRYADGGDTFRRSFVGTARRDAHWGLNFNARFGD
ncbi:MAG: TonB-dependent receptor [Pseudomonadota bacterium]